MTEKPDRKRRHRRYINRPFEFPASVQGQLNTVFICFASVVHHAQQFEEVFEGLLTALNNVAPQPVTAEDLENNRSIGLPASKARSDTRVDYLAKRKQISTALKQKSFLLHRYFMERTRELDSDRGRRQMMTELLRIEHNLVRSRLAISRYWIAIWEDPPS